MLALRVRSVTWEAEDILSFELVHPAGDPLPEVSAGAHLDVRTPNGLMRRYSLCDAPWHRDHWRIGVLDVDAGRGGSRAMHRDLHAGQMLDVGGPHNFFRLSADARHSILLAGGIGLTPLMAMAEQLARDGASWEMHACTRSPERTPFLRRLHSPPFAGHVQLHHDAGRPAQGLDIAALLREQRPGTHVYYCGPPGFMQTTQTATAHWPSGSVHFEHFGAEPVRPSSRPAVVLATDGMVVLKRSAREIPVPDGKTVLQALREAGVDCPSSCEAGVCRTCETRWLDGDPEHHDHVLSDADRERVVLICCARPGLRPLVLDL